MSVAKRSIVVTAVLLISSLLVPTPAFASEANGVIGGTGAVTDDWGDEGNLSMNQHRYSYAVGVWQNVLYAEHTHKADGSLFQFSDIDCDFGPDTKAATIELQRRHNLIDDGIAGNQTFSFFDGRLAVEVENDPYGIAYHSYYDGAWYGALQRVNGQYRVYGPHNQKYNTAYYNQGSGGC